MGFTQKELEELRRYKALMEEHREDPPINKPVKLMTKEERDLQKLFYIQGLMDTGASVSKRQLLEYMKTPGAPPKAKAKAQSKGIAAEEAPNIDSTKAGTQSYASESDKSDKKRIVKQQQKKREIKVKVKRHNKKSKAKKRGKGKKTADKSTGTLTDNSQEESKPLQIEEDIKAKDEADKVNAEIERLISEYYDQGTEEEQNVLAALSQQLESMERQSPEAASKLQEIAQVLKAIKKRLIVQRIQKQGPDLQLKKLLVREDNDLPDEFLEEPKLLRYKDVAKDLMAVVLPTNKLFPSHTLTTQHDYNTYMRNVDWRFVDYSNSEVDARNAYNKEHHKDMEEVPQAQELPESKNILDADIRAYSMKTGKQFKFRVGAIWNYLRGYESKRLQLFLGASIFNQIMPKNYKALAQAAGSSDMRAFVGPVRQPQIEDQKYATGLIYSADKGVEPLIAFDLERVYGVKRFFRGEMPQEFNDCVVHAVNSALGFPYFRYREQIIRLMARRQYGTMEIAAYKKHHLGVRMNIFLETFAVTKIADDKWRNYRFKKILQIEFDKTTNKKYEAENLQRLVRLLEKGEIREGSSGRFILMVYYIDLCKHAYALCVDKKGVVSLYDSSEQSVLYTNKEGTKQYNLSEIYLKGHILNLYELRCRETKEPENFTLIKQMMTGEEWSIQTYNDQVKENRLRQELMSAAYNDDTSDSVESEGEPPAHRKVVRYNRRQRTLSNKKQHRVYKMMVPKQELEPEDIEEEDYE